MDKRKAIQIMNDSLKIMKRKYVYKENAEMLHKTEFACKATPYKVVFVAVNDEEFLDFIYEGDSEITAKKRALIVHEFMLIPDEKNDWKWLRIATGNEYDNSKTGDFPFTQKKLSTTIYNDFESLIEFLTELVATSKFENPDLKKWLEY